MRRKDREITEMQGIIDILNHCKTCNVAMVDDGMPYVVPLSYGYCIKEGLLTLYFHSAKEGRKINIFEKNSSVCFSIFQEGEPIIAETPCNSGYYFSSIIGDGQIEFIEDINEKRQALAAMYEHQVGKRVEFTEKQTQAVLIYKLVSNSFVGKKKG